MLYGFGQIFFFSCFIFSFFFSAYRILFFSNIPLVDESTLSGSMVTTVWALIAPANEAITASDGKKSMVV